MTFRLEDFGNVTFLRIRRQVALLRLQTADNPALVDLLRESVVVYDEMIGSIVAKRPKNRTPQAAN